jgi:hypothetical protein
MHEPSVLEGLPELVGVRVVFELDWYDGPLDGVAEYNGRQWWFTAVSDRVGSSVPSCPRVLVVHEVTQDQVRQAEVEADQFRAFAQGRGEPGAWEAAWDARMTYDDAPAIGWFRWPT